MSLMVFWPRPNEAIIKFPLVPAGRDYKITWGVNLNDIFGVLNVSLHIYSNLGQVNHWAVMAQGSLRCLVATNDEASCAHAAIGP